MKSAVSDLPETALDQRIKNDSIKRGCSPASPFRVLSPVDSKNVLIRLIKLVGLFSVGIIDLGFKQSGIGLASAFDGHGLSLNVEYRDAAAEEIGIVFRVDRRLVQLTEFGTALHLPAFFRIQDIAFTVVPQFFRAFVQFRFLLFDEFP